MDWLIENLGTIVVSLCLLIIAGLIVFSMIKRKKKGRSGCGCECSCCPNCGNCHKN